MMKTRCLRNRGLTALVLLAVLFTTVPLNLAQDAPPPPPPAATGIVRGSLVDVNGQPLVGYRLRVVDTDGKVYESAPTGPDGKYEILDVPPGTYRYEILDAEGITVPVRIPPVQLDAGMSVTQPIAIVPRRGRKGPAIAWALGGAGAVALGVLIANSGGDDDDDPPMSP